MQALELEPTWTFNLLHVCRRPKLTAADRSTQLESHLLAAVFVGCTVAPFLRRVCGLLPFFAASACCLLLVLPAMRPSLLAVCLGLVTRP